MEIIIILLIVLVFLFYTFLLKPVYHAVKYIEIVESGIEVIQSEENLTTLGFQSRVKEIKEIGLKNSLVYNILELRLSAKDVVKISAEYFDGNNAIRKAENKMTYTYASVYAPNENIYPDDIDAINKVVRGISKGDDDDIIKFACSMRSKFL